MFRSSLSIDVTNFIYLDKLNLCKFSINSECRYVAKFNKVAEPFARSRSGRLYANMGIKVIK